MGQLYGVQKRQLTVDERKNFSDDFVSQRTKQRFSLSHKSSSISNVTHDSSNHPTGSHSQPLNNKLMRSTGVLPLTSLDQRVTVRVQQQADELPIYNDERLKKIIEQTAKFLSYEIEPSLMMEYMNGREKKRAGKSAKQCYSAVNYPNVQDIYDTLSKILQEPASDNFRKLSAILRKSGGGKIAVELLDCLDQLLKLTTHDINANTHTENNSYKDNSLELRCLPDVTCKCGCFSFGETLSRESFCWDLDIEIQYAHRESRLTQTAKQIISLKKQKQVKSLSNIKYCSDVKEQLSSDVRDQIGSDVREQVGSDVRDQISSDVREQFRSDPMLDSTCVDASDLYVPVLSVFLLDQCLCDRRIRCLEKALESSTCIRDLYIWRARFDVPAMIRLFRAVGKVEGLVELSLSGCSLGNDGLMYLASALSTNSSIRVIDLSHNHISSRGAKLIAKGLRKNRTLVDLDLGSNAIENSGCITIANLLCAAGSSLRKLRIKNNAIKDSGFRFLFKSLRRNFKLTHLDISENIVGEGSLRVLSEVLLINRSLRELVASDCGISGRACESLIRPLRANNSLRYLCLKNNTKLGDTGLELLANGLKYNRAVQELYLDNCGISNVGFLRLLDALRYNSTLRTVNLCDNKITITSRSNIIDTAPNEHLRPTSKIRSRGFSPMRNSYFGIPSVYESSEDIDVISFSALNSKSSTQLDTCGRDSGSDLINYLVYDRLLDLCKNNRDSKLSIHLLGNHLDKTSQEAFRDILAT